MLTNIFHGSLYPLFINNCTVCGPKNGWSDQRRTGHFWVRILYKNVLENVKLYVVLKRNLRSLILKVTLLWNELYRSCARKIKPSRKSLARFLLKAKGFEMDETMGFGVFDNNRRYWLLKLGCWETILTNHLKWVNNKFLTSLNGL